MFYKYLEHIYTLIRMFMEFSRFSKYYFYFSRAKSIFLKILDIFPQAQIFYLDFMSQAISKIVLKFFISLDIFRVLKSLSGVY